MAMIATFPLQFAICNVFILFYFRESEFWGYKYLILYGTKIWENKGTQKNEIVSLDHLIRYLSFIPKLKLKKKEWK